MILNLLCNPSRALYSRRLKRLRCVLHPQEPCTVVNVDKTNLFKTEQNKRQYRVESELHGMDYKCNKIPEENQISMGESGQAREQA